MGRKPSVHLQPSATRHGKTLTFISVNARSESCKSDKEEVFYPQRLQKLDFRFCICMWRNRGEVTVQQLTEIPIKRHIKIKCEANPFDPSWDEYFERRKLKSARQRA